ncbi:MAG: RNA methyltransferase [Candidatus Aminicenantes bacterium]
MPTKKRKKRIDDVLSRRQPDLRVVLEDITNTHNASAVARTCDAAGILYIDIIYSSPEPFPINESISTKAEKWLQFNHFSSTKECFLFLKKKKYKIASTHLGPDALPYNSIDYTQPIALVFGNEKEGVSDQALKLSDYLIQIPMFGMVQSLNLSVSAGIILYEACQQRMKKGWYDKSRLTEKTFKKFWNEWLGIK